MKKIIYMSNVHSTMNDLNDYVNEQKEINKEFKVINIQWINNLKPEYSSFFMLFYTISL